MIDSSLEKPNTYLRRLLELLSENNKNKDSILIFLVKLALFMFLGSSGIIKSFPEIVQKIKETKSPSEMKNLIENYFELMAQEQNNEVQLNYLFPIIGEPFSIKEELPEFSSEFYEYLKTSSTLDFKWKTLSALNFCNIFESFINIEEKHSRGMYFTSDENILKVIEPLFLNQLEEELNHILKLNKGVTQRLLKFQEKISHLTFLDPACGVGNFLVKTYNTLKGLEKRILNYLEKIQIDFYNNSVSLDQFYGIEISPSAVIIAKTALLITEIQHTEDNDIILLFPYQNKNVIQANALRFDWNQLIPNSDLNFILGNPPFLGARLMEKDQKEDMQKVFGSDWFHVGDLDYVSCWYKKSYEYMKGTEIEAAFVSTSSITEGISAAYLFKPLIRDGFTIDFAYQSFEWNQEISQSAFVYVVIIGFRAYHNPKEHYIFTQDNQYLTAKHINGYLIDGPEIYAESRVHPISQVPEMGIGNKPVDGGHFLFKEDEYNEFIRKVPESQPFFKPFYGAMEFVKQQPRYCLWLGDSDESEYSDIKEIKEIIQNVIDFRLSSRSKGTRILAQKPTHFHVENMPETNFLAIPRVSTSIREYIPIGFMNPDVLVSDAMLIIPNVDYYHFGVLTSNLHMIWLKFVCGRLGKSFRYSKHIVYNNFPWPEASQEDKEKIIKTATNILKVRERYKDINLKVLYDPKQMPEDLRQAHKKNDKVVLKAYHFKKQIKDDRDLVLLLFDRYREILENSNSDS